MMESPLNSAKRHGEDNGVEMKHQQKPGVTPNFEEQNLECTLQLKGRKQPK
jgi:hypothetical protein